MANKQITVSQEQAGMRLDKLLVQAFGLSRSQSKRLFSEGSVRIGRHIANKGDVVGEGQTIEVELPELNDDAPAVPDDSPEFPLEILLERHDLVIINKPAGQPSAPLRGGERGTAANALVARFPEMANVGFSVREPGLLHRLDNYTSGVLLAARKPEVFDVLREAMKQELLDKTYLVLCEDNDLPDVGEIDIPLAPHPKDKRKVLACLHPRDISRLKPRFAETSYQVISRNDSKALVKVSVSRAQRHQIRAHFSALNCPIVGDVLYGAIPIDGELGYALHAASLGWNGDSNVSGFFVEAALPADWSSRFGFGASEDSPNK
jgi:23S rRNA pseudouridine1911/1915/1917 synthase